MAQYYANNSAVSNGDHEVHEWACIGRPRIYECVYLGEFSNCGDAVTEARKTNPKAKGCVWCAVR